MVRRLSALHHKTVWSVRLEFRGLPPKLFFLKTQTQTQTPTDYMFDFEKLGVYHKAKTYNKIAKDFLCNSSVDKVTHDQLRRASFSIMLNIAEGAGRFTNADRRNFYVIARGSVFECVAIFDYLKDNNEIGQEEFDVFYSALEELSIMLFAMIKGLTK